MILDSCRACKGTNLLNFLPMGDHPPANMFIRKEDLGKPQPAFALDTISCLDCGLIQVADQIPADFFRHYLYVPSGAATMHGHFDGLASVIHDIAGDGPDAGLVVDIGSNDGLLLSACNKRGCSTLGVDPAANLAELARARGVDVHVAYFNVETARLLRHQHGPAKVIVTTNTFNHIGDLHAFMAGVEELLADDGTFIIEVPWALDLLQKNEFDTVYQEHLSEFSLRSLVVLGAHFGMAVMDVDQLSVHGGSMRVQLRRDEAGAVASALVDDMLAREAAGGMHETATYEAFSSRVGKVGVDLVRMIDELKASGMKLAGYGAPAKGNTLLNYFQIGPDRLDFLVDRNPLKHGLYSPGMQIPVRPTDAIASEKPDVLLVLAWNFFDEIREQQQDFIAAGGRFLVPLPEPVLVS